MKKYTTALLLTASLGLASATLADEKKKDRPAPGGDAVQRDGDRPRDGGDRRRDGDRPKEGARDGDRRPEGPRDGDGPPRDGDRRPDGPPRGPGGMMEMLQAADTDGDKKISLDEWKAAAAKRAAEAFKRLDGDGDGYITREDMEKMRERFGGDRPRPGGPESDRPRAAGPREVEDGGAGGPRRPQRPDAE